MADKKKAGKAQTGADPAVVGSGATSDHRGEDLGGDEVQAKVDVETEQGYRGVKVDPTPNENYTVAGVTSGAPTPETDPEAAAKAGSAKFTGLPEKEKE